MLNQIMSSNLYQVLVISISSPIKIGLNKNNELVKTYEKEGKTSDLLPEVLKEILEENKIQKISYVNSPGSYMAIKVAYVFLKTICITKNIEFLACSGFNFNDNSPIKALGKKYFFNKDGEISIDFLDKDCTISQFELPEVLNEDIFTSNTLPIYNLPAV